MRSSKWFSVLALGALSLSIACDGNGGDYDAELLAQYKKALPSESVLQPGTPGNEAAMAMAVGDPAEYPPMGVEPTRAINDTVKGIVDILDFVTDQEPTIYNSETQEFVWGPWADDDNDSNVENASVLVYIKDQGEDGDHDFRYVYALGRLIGEDMSTLQPVIWGGANVDPDNEDHGSGITLWDFEANRAFVEEHNPDATEFETEGRFVAVYGKGPAEDNPDAIHTIVAASFRNFRDDADDQAGSLDHLYGRVEDGENTVDFISMELIADMFPEETQGETEDETLNIDMAFFNEGAGRAEVSVVGGELDTSEEVSTLLAEECWDPGLNRLYLDVTAITPNGDEVTMGNEGAEVDCGFFALSLTTLGIPSLETIPAEHRAALAEIAENGITD